MINNRNSLSKYFFFERIFIITLNFIATIHFHSSHTIMLSSLFFLNFVEKLWPVCPASIPQYFQANYIFIFKKNQREKKGIFAKRKVILINGLGD